MTTSAHLTAAVRSMVDEVQNAAYDGYEDAVLAQVSCTTRLVRAIEAGGGDLSAVYAALNDHPVADSDTPAVQLSTPTVPTTTGE